MFLNFFTITNFLLSLKWLIGLFVLLLFSAYFLVFFFVLPVSAVSSQAALAADKDLMEGGLQKELVVTDYANRLVILDNPAKRIISLAPHITENIFSAGAGHLIVGAVDFSDYPEAAKIIPRVGNIQGFSAETIVALKPDLIIAWGTGHSANIIQKLIDLGLTVYIDEPKILEDVAKSIQDIATMTGQKKLAAKSIEAYLQKLDVLKQRYSGREKISVLYQVWDKPLRTISGDHIISDVIGLCGGQNSFADAAVIAPKISIESVLARNPSAIIASGMGSERSDWLDNWSKWRSLRAVNDKNLFFIPPDLLQRHTVRILQGAEILCDQLETVRNKYKPLKN
ncbi:MAG: iron complex transport system substrate-binding protein [Cellvibrionaceae bacterium]|jgi:iron complex transport system substrate-binding protein